MTAPFAEHLKTLPDLPVIRADTGDLATLADSASTRSPRRATAPPSPTASATPPAASSAATTAGYAYRCSTTTAPATCSDRHRLRGDGEGRQDQGGAGADGRRQAGVRHPRPAVPVLSRVAAHPYLARDGSVIAEPGFRDGVYLADRLPGVEVPDTPSPAQVAAARDLILEDMLGDFPFTGYGERAHAVALLVRRSCAT